MLLRLIASTFLVSAMVCGADLSLGQNYPNKPIRIVTGGIGGSADLVARFIGYELTGPLGQPVIIDNRGGLLPQQVVAQAHPDGYTLLLHSSATWLNPLMQETSYDPIKDFLPITSVTSSSSILVVHPSLRLKSVQQLEVASQI
jgi:tripartite-type tricarboxylate transporter receptor subunit TctC